MDTFFPMRWCRKLTTNWLRKWFTRTRFLESKVSLWQSVLTVSVCWLSQSCTMNPSTTPLPENSSSLPKAKVSTVAVFQSTSSSPPVIRGNPMCRSFVMQFPSSATNFHNWDIQESHDLKTWFDVQRNVYTISWNVVWWTNAPHLSVWRYHGRP